MGQVVNDDGPPSNVSPYFRPFIDALHRAGHSTVVVIPDAPLSWIGKAHAVGKTLTATSVCPDALSGAVCKADDACEAGNSDHRWLILNGPPASCTQIGLFHCGHLAEDFDAVISGPNHGPNASTIYNLSSGTVGGALEGALCGRKAIALSFGSKEAQPPERIQTACHRAISLVEHLCREWAPGVELYNVNVPMVEALEDRPVHYTTPSRAYWSKGSLFHAVTPTEDVHDEKKSSSSVMQYQWAPEFSDIKRQTEKSVAGEDLWAFKQGYVRLVLNLSYN